MSVFQSNPSKHEPISAERLFQLAFSMSREQFRQVSCLGWRPVVLPAACRCRSQPRQAPLTVGKDNTKLPADVLVFQDQGNLVVEFILDTAIKDELCLALAGNILTVDCCPPPKGWFSSGSRRRCIVLPPEVTREQIKARIIDNRLRVEVQRACP